MAAIRLVVRTLPSTGMGPWSSMACSPWTSMGPALAGDDGEGREDALGLAGAVLGGELQLEAGVEGARAHTEGVEQGVGRGPGPLDGRGGRSLGSRVDRHGPIIAPNDVTLKLS